MWHIKMNNPENKLTDKNKSTKQKAIVLAVKFESNVNGVLEEIADHWNVDSTVIQRTLSMNTEKLGEGKLVEMNEESSFNEKNKGVSGEVTEIMSQQRHYWKYYTLKHTKNQMLNWSKLWKRMPNC